MGKKIESVGGKELGSFASQVFRAAAVVPSVSSGTAIARSSLCSMFTEHSSQLTFSLSRTSFAISQTL